MDKDNVLVECNCCGAKYDISWYEEDFYEDDPIPNFCPNCGRPLDIEEFLDEELDYE
jgi:hypothetical protein